MAGVYCVCCSSCGFARGSARGVHGGVYADEGGVACGRKNRALCTAHFAQALWCVCFRRGVFSSVRDCRALVLVVEGEVVEVGAGADQRVGF